jgi:hypothetical protein
MKKLITLIAAGIIFSACQKNHDGSCKDQLTTQEKIIIPTGENSTARSTEEDQYNTFYGPAVQFGDGHARSWANITHDNKALAIGIEFTEGVLQQQHEHIPDAGEHGHTVLMLHQKAKAVMPFDHLTMGFMTAGHPPPGIYSVSHFDFHFYKMGLNERLAIPAFSPATAAAFNNLPSLQYIPTGYFRSPNEGIIKMGTHWVDLLSPEFNGQPFTHTFIYGSYDGKVTFLEPMVTLATFQSGVTVQKQIRQPQLFDPVNTYYPSRYDIWKNEVNNRHYVAMDQMVFR